MLGLVGRVGRLNRLMLISTQAEVVVEVGVELGNMNIKHETAEECLEDEKNATTDKTTMAWVYDEARYI